jgi:16S rRNA (uracil1498-N3)-methyltransferase
MLPRFYVPDLKPEDGSARLSPEESHHLARVLRLVRGDPAAVFDGRGVEWRARVDQASREAARLTLIEPVATRTPRVSIALLQAVLKSESMEDVIRDATMAGVAAIRPIVAARTTVKASTLRSAPERWRRVALSSAKQCGMATLPAIHDVVRFDQWLPPVLPQHSYLLIEPDSAPADVTTVRQLAMGTVPDAATLLVGPEGGWTADERDAAIAAGARPLSLGPMTLRASTVALAATAALVAIWDE